MSQYLLLAAAVFCAWMWRRTFKQSQENSALYEDLVRNIQSDKAQALSRYAMHQAVFNSLVEGFLLLDSSNRIVAANQPLVRLFELQTDPEGQKILEVLRHHQLLDLIESASKSGIVEGYELLLLRPRARTLRVNAAAVFNEGRQRLGTVLVFHDITRIKELENVRKDFVANVSHELRTPVTLIQSAIETLVNHAKDDPVASARFMETIRRQSQRLSLLIDDLLVISELEAGRTQLNLSVAPLQPVVHEVVEQLTPRAKEKKIRIENNVMPDQIACFDGARLEQVLTNLIENAIKYTHSGGMIQISAQPLDGQVVKMSVADNGPGIPREACERIFERFYRLDRSRARANGGTGLGLSIVKHIVQAHGGNVWVESAVGNGSTFNFTLRTKG